MHKRHFVRASLALAIGLGLAATVGLAVAQVAIDVDGGAVAVVGFGATAFVLTEAGSSELVSRLFMAARLQPNIRYRCSQLLSTLEAVSRGDGLSLVAEASLPQAHDPRYVRRPLSPRVPRQIGLAVLDRRQSSPATGAAARGALSATGAGVGAGAFTGAATGAAGRVK